jgi:hypothetical protein
MPCCTEAKRDANRRNAKRSTGPKTREGKARSSRNALKHGFTAAGSALTPLEDRDAYESYTASIAESLRPATAMEQDLAQRIADLSWRLRRIPDAEAALLARDTLADLHCRCAHDPHQRDDDDDDQQEQQGDVHGDDDAPVTPEPPARLLAGAMSLPQNPYLTLQRYESALDRARSRALKELRQLQKDRRQHAADAEEAPPRRRNEPTAPTSNATPSPSGGAGRGEGEGPAHDDAGLRNEPTTPSAADRPPTPPARGTNGQGPVTATGELPDEPTAPPRSPIANPESQTERPPTIFHLKRSDLRPLHQHHDEQLAKGGPPR